jgi:hypothetical protein
MSLATGEAGHVRGGGPSVTAGGAAVVVARGRNPGGTAGAGRGATGGSKPVGISGAGWRGDGVEVPVVVRWVLMVETVGPDSKKI